MSKKLHKINPKHNKSQAIVFAALGDETRLLLVAQLCDGSLQSISQLAQQSELTRQAITKHLHVLELAGIVQSKRVGRENLFQLQAERIDAAKQYLALVSQQWEQALLRLKSFVEQ